VQFTLRCENIFVAGTFLGAAARGRSGGERLRSVSLNWFR
jgi:hypothetical protein